MEKPQTMSMKDWLIRKTAVDLSIPERVVNDVINHQFEGGIEAMKTNDSLEFSGWAKFYFNRKRAERKMKKYVLQKEALEKWIEESPNEAKTKKLNTRLNKIMENINILAPKLQ